MRDCKYHDKACPCQDGDACHYEDCGDTKGWDPRYVLLARIAALEALRDSHAEFVRKVREFAENMQAYNTGRATAGHALIALCDAELAKEQP